MGETATDEVTTQALTKSGGVTTGKIAKTEAGDGMFGADVDLESLTDSEEEDDDDVAQDVGASDILKQSAKFKIVAGEDSDSIFEERLQQDGKFEDMDYDDYDDEDWALDAYDEMNEQAPEQLPLETILEENSQMKDSPPQANTTKAGNGAGTTKPRRPATGSKASKGHKRSPSPRKRPATSPSKAKPAPKGKTMHQSPSSRRYPEMSEHERKMAESDAYLRKLHAKSAKSRPGLVVIQKRENKRDMADAEESQMSAWTAESQFNVEAREKEQTKKQQQ